MAAAIIELLRPIQTRYAELSADPTAVTDVLRAGAVAAEAVAAKTYERAREAIGLLSP